MFDEKTARRLNELIDHNRARILATAEHIWKNPETGYREWKTQEFMAGQFRELGYEPVFAGNIPGFYADLDTGRPGPGLALLAELDSVICASHPDADPVTGAVHACGHHTQCANLLGAAAVLREKDVLSLLSGKIRFVVVPAEELLEIGFRSELKRNNTITYLGGKVEFLYRGIFDGIAAAVMIHSGGHREKPVSLYRGNNGCIVKYIRYTGKAAHAGGSPDRAINALYAATLGINAVNAVRETFREENVTRFHPIITEGGAAVNVIPDTTRLESYVRGATPDAIVSETKKINRALAGAALSLGARVNVTDIPGYMPLNNDAGLNSLARDAAAAMLGSDKVELNDKWNAGSTDMGDLGCVMPVVHASGGGGEGAGHGSDYRVVNPEAACVDSARFLVGTATALLENSGAALAGIAAASKPLFASKAEYFDFIDKLYTDRELVSYNGDKAEVIW